MKKKTINKQDLLEKKEIHFFSKKRDQKKSKRAKNLD